MILFIGVGFGETIRWALGQALVIENANTRYRARMASLTMMTYGLIPLAAFPIGWLVDKCRRCSNDHWHGDSVASRQGSSCSLRSAHRLGNLK